jgi:hypothetical protein
MRKSFTAVIERNTIIASDLDTEPYECAWASEARWFIRVLEMNVGSRMLARAQISPDGLFWMDEGTEFPEIREPGLYSTKLREFGGWLRLHCEIGGNDSSAKVLIYLVLKE